MEAIFDWFEQIMDWMGRHRTLFWWLGLGSGVLFLATLVAVPVVVARIPHDHYRVRRRAAEQKSALQFAIWVIAMILKNVLGVALVLAGIAMLVLPGQGVITVFIGVMLLNFPGKARLELWIISRPAVLRSINWMRQKMHKPPLELPDTVG
ncbi:MAG: hypothetical protein KY476_23200 [Planctomycetes bacterium]|nr:hypothetical protein [Planctomycetota bacterium]